MVNLEDERGELTVYELGFLILPSIPEDKLSLITDAIRKVIIKEGGTEIDSEVPFKQPLAYTMSKTIGASRYVLPDAYLGWIKFDLPAEASAKAGVEHSIEKIRNNLKKIEEVLRFLLIKAPRETTFTFAKARAAMENKEESESSPVEEVVIK